MQTKFLSVIFLFAAFGATQDVDLDDIPKACQQACQDISRLSEDCDDQNDDDTAELNCTCNADSAQQLANSCAACVKANVQSDDDDDDEEDIRDLFSACGWNYANVSATSGVITTTQTFAASTTIETASGITTTKTLPASTVTSTGSASPSSATTDTAENAGAGVTAGVGIIAAGLMAALPAVL